MRISDWSTDVCYSDLAWFPNRQAEEALKREQPDVALVQAGAPLRMAKALRAAGARTVVYLRDVEFHELGADPAELPGLRYIANSRFVAEKFHADRKSTRLNSSH